MRETTRIIIFSILILFLSQAFMVVLVADSFEETHLSATMTNYALPQKDFSRKLEAGFKFGKSLENMLGIQGLMEDYAQKYTDLKNIEIYSSDENLLYSLSPPSRNFSSALDIQGKTIKVPDPVTKAKETADSYIIIQPLFGSEQTWMGSTSDSLKGYTVFSFEKHEISAGIVNFWKQRALIGLAILICASIVMIALLYRLHSTSKYQMRRNVFIRVLGTIILGQVAFAGINVYLYYQDHIQGVREKIGAQLNLLGTDMETILSKGISLERITGMDDFLTELLEVNSEVDSLAIFDQKNNMLASASGKDEPARDALNFEDGNNELILSTPLSGDQPGVKAGYIKARLDRSALMDIIWELILDAVTVALIAYLFIIEQIYFFMSRIGRSRTQDSSDQTEEEQLDRLMLARFGAFVFLFAFALPISFVPLQMKELYSPMLGLPRDVVLGLPISLEMLCALAASLAAGFLSDRKDWRAPFAAGILLTATGFAFCALAATGIQFILARGLCGLGYGLSWMALQSFLFSYSSPSTRARGSSHFVAGIFSGHICGTALGAIIADRVGYPPVFVTGFFITLASLIFFFLFMRRLKGGRTASATADLRPRAVLSYLMDRNAAALMFLSIIPFSICQVGLLFFATPLYLNQLGIAQSDIGRVLMIYGLSVVYLAPQVSRIVDRYDYKKKFIAAGGLLGGLGLSLLFFDQSIITIIAAIFLLGLGSSIGTSAQTAFALKLRATNILGQGTAMAIQRAADKLGQMLGPLALGAVMSAVSIAQGLMFLGMAYMLLSFVFLAAAREAG
ncbi:MAG: MFS transporter [Desulfonatronovibrionaceae bacterium]